MNTIKKMIVGNWKMNPQTVKDATKLFEGINKQVPKPLRVVPIICAPYIYLPLLKKSKVLLGAQNIFTEAKGSYTGEISIDMVKNFKISHVIIGHSERRKMGETDEMVNKKVHLALEADITPIICIGETTRDEEGSYLGFLKGQLEQGLKGVSRNAVGRVIIAYEPVWAIGASTAMNAHDVHQMTLFIKKALIDIYKSKTITGIPVLYGGAVDPTNAHGILTEGEADGLLIGRQSLDAKSFGEILQIANNI